MPASPDSASSETVALRAALGATLERLAAEPKPNEEPAAGEAGVLPTGVLQRIEQLETNYGRLAVVNQDLLQRVETAESERESATLERDAALTDKDRLGGELSVVRSDLETAREQEGLLQRSLSDATGTVQRLEGQVTKLEHDVTQLAEQELPRPPISNAQAVERTFVANDLLENQAQDAEQHLERLNSEQKTLEEQLKTIKGDRARTPLLTRMIAIEQERTAISRSLQLT
jgi:predicted  nucleic acid-binding Zn-ribbon protein